ncbi:transposase [Streptomyces microflavus]|uniref:transposase n=1 Tax=Streptomyces microflavus TaxID=1919 RepID=UPI0038014CEE
MVEALHRHSHSNCGGVDVDRLRAVPAGLPLRRFEGGRPALAVDVSPWLRSDAPCSAERVFLPRLRPGGVRLPVLPGLAVLVRRRPRTGSHFPNVGPGRGRARTEDDATAVTAPQLRAVAERFISASQWAPGDPDVTIVMDAGYDVTRLAWILRDLPVELVGRVRGDRVMRLPKPPPEEYAPGPSPRWQAAEARQGVPLRQTRDRARGSDHHRHRQLRHGRAQAWGRVHPRLPHRSSWPEHDGELAMP